MGDGGGRGGVPLAAVVVGMTAGCVSSSTDAHLSDGDSGHSSSKAGGEGAEGV